MVLGASLRNIFLKLYASIVYSLFTFIITKGYEKISSSNNQKKTSKCFVYRSNYNKLLENVFSKFVSIVGNQRLEYVKEVNCNFYKLVIKPFSLEDIIMSMGLWEREIKKILRVEDGQVFIDVGAHIGTYTIPIAKQVGSKGKVIAFEPHPKSSEMLERSIKINHLENVTLIKKPVTDQKKKVKFGISNQPTISSIYFNKDTKYKIELEGIDLDSCVNEIKLTRLDWIKIDAEGSEIDVLNGARQILKKYSPRIIMEIVEENQLKAKEILTSLGYEFKSIDKYQFFASKI